MMMMKIFTLVLFAAFFLFKPFYAHAQKANVDDSLALVDLYNSTDGNNWARHDNWLIDNVINWRGISLDGNGRVTSIYLFESNLNGHIPSSLGNLTNLTYFDLGVNKLSGVIPPSLGNLQNLEDLYLDNNQLSGNIPDSLSKLANIQLLYLDGNQINGNIPDWLGNLTSLASIALGHNQFVGGIPVSLGKLVNLHDLYLNNDQLTGNIPSSLGNLNGLLNLDLSYNNLSGNIPSTLGNDSALGYVYLGNNQLSGKIPSSIGNLSQLYMLNLDDNKLDDSIPATILNLKTSTYLGLAINNFTFSGMEQPVQVFSGDYGLQSAIPLHFANKKLSVSAGGTLTNNTYTWYSSNTPVAAVTGDSTYTPPYPGSYWVKVSNNIVTKFSLLTLHSDTLTITNAELPITYLNFTAQPTHNGNLLQWQTATEINSDYFNVQRSTDGVRFTNIAQISAAGNSSTVQSYQYTDALTGLNPVPPALFYRLQEADKDGDVTYSKIIKLDNNSVPQVSLNIFPNPVHEVLNVQLQGITGAATISITDASGKTLQVREVNAVSGQTISINTQALAAGVYFIQVLHDKQGITQKFVKE